MVFDTKNVEIIVVLTSQSEKTLLMQEYHDIPSVKFVVGPTNEAGGLLRTGIKAATGRFIKLINPTGWVNPWGLSSLTKQLKKLDCDVVVIGYRSECLKHESTQEIQPLTANQVGLIQQEAELLEVLPWPALIVKASLLKEVIVSPLPETFYFAYRCLMMKALSRATKIKVLNGSFFRAPEEDLQCQEVTDFKQRLSSEKFLRVLLVDSNVRQNLTLAKFLQRAINEHYECYYQTYSATRKELAELLAFTKFLKREFPDFYETTPAAKNITLRLSWPNRKIKQVLLG